MGHGSQKIIHFHLCSVVAQSIVIKFLHMFDGDLSLLNKVQKIGVSSPPPQKKTKLPQNIKFGANFGKLRNLISNI